MGRTLSQAVVSGGVFYPAGATVPAEKADAITADVWAAGSKRPEPVDSEPESEDGGSVSDGKQTSRKSRKSAEAEG